MRLLTEYCRRRRAELILPELKRGWKILDLGCGDMWLTKFLQKKGFNCVGIDLRTGDVRGSAYEMPFPDNCFDCIIMIEVIEHLNQGVYKEIIRVLKNKLIVTTHYPNTDFILKLLISLKLINDFGTPEIYSTRLENFELNPLKLVEKKMICLFDQYGVFVKGKNEKLSRKVE